MNYKELIYDIVMHLDIHKCLFNSKINSSLKLKKNNLMVNSIQVF